MFYFSIHLVLSIVKITFEKFNVFQIVYYNTIKRTELEKINKFLPTSCFRRNCSLKFIAYLFKLLKIYRMIKL